MPGVGPNSEQFSKSFDFLNRKSSVDPVVENFNTGPSGMSLGNSSSGAGGQSRRSLELMEKEKNWIYADPKDYGKTPTPEEMFNLEEYGRDGLPKKTQHSWEIYIDSTDTKSNGSTNGVSLSRSGGARGRDQDEVDTDDPSNKPADRDTATGMGAKQVDKFDIFGAGRHSYLSDGADGVSFKSALIPDKSMTSFGVPQVSDTRARAEQQAQLEELKQIIDTGTVGGPKTPLAQLDSPFSLSPAAAGAPGTSSALDDLAKMNSAGETKSALAPAPGLSSTLMSRPSALDGFSAKSFDVPGLYQSALTPPPSQLITPRPSILPFPQRKF